MFIPSIGFNARRWTKHRTIVHLLHLLCLEFSFQGTQRWQICPCANHALRPSGTQTKLAPWQRPVTISGGSRVGLGDPVERRLLPTRGYEPRPCSSVATAPLTVYRAPSWQHTSARFLCLCPERRASRKVLHVFGYFTVRRDVQETVNPPGETCTAKCSPDAKHITRQATGITYSEFVVCSLSYHACNAHASYCHLWLYNVFPHYLINCTIFGEKLLNTKCVF